MDSFITLGGGSSGQIPTVATVSALSGITAPAGALRYVIENDTLYSSDGSTWTAVAGGGSGAVDSVNGLTGVVVLTKSDIGLGNVNNTSDLNKPISTATQTALDAKQDILTGSFNSVAGFDGSGDPWSIPGFQISTTSGGLQVSLTEAVEDAASDTTHSLAANYNPTENSPATTWRTLALQSNIDTDNDGFSFGTGGAALRSMTSDLSHQGSSDTGDLDHIVLNANIGNETDAITIGGYGLVYGFGEINADVTVDGPVQGYGFQPNIDAGATLTSNYYAIGFYDSAVVGTASLYHTSFNASPTLDSIANNGNYTGLSINPDIDSFVGNAGVNAISVAGQFGTMNANSSWNGLNVNPTITQARYAAGINVSMDNVGTYAGVQSTLTEQDLTFTFNQAGDNNSYTLEYTPGATAGSEVVTISGQAIEVQIEDGVSTATQIKTAMDAIGPLTSAITITISGTGSNPQDVFGPSNFVNGVNPGTKQAAYLDGDVQITGALAFGGALSIGQLNAFASQEIVSGSGNPASIHTLITQPFVDANATVTAGDTIAVNTAALINIGDNASVSTSFLGITALGLPAVLTMGTGSTIDRVSAAAFALSLDVGAGGGTVNDMELCRSIAIPNGSTTVNNLYGFKMDLPFGDPGTSTWGVYITPTSANNYFAKNVLVGSTTPTNASVGVELNATDRALLVSRLNNTQEGALTAVNGMIIYNTSTNKFRGYAGGSWVDLH